MLDIVKLNFMKMNHLQRWLCSRSRTCSGQAVIRVFACICLSLVTGCWSPSWIWISLWQLGPHVPHQRWKPLSFQLDFNMLECNANENRSRKLCLPSGKSPGENPAGDAPHWTSHPSQAQFCPPHPTPYIGEDHRPWSWKGWCIPLDSVPQRTSLWTSRAALSRTRETPGNHLYFVILGGCHCNVYGLKCCFPLDGKVQSLHCSHTNLHTDTQHPF